MDENRKDSLPEFDSEYIDQLFSAGRSSAKKEAPPPPPEKPRPKPEPAPEQIEEPQPEEPEQAPVASSGSRPNPLLLLAAVALLVTGFLLGRLTAPEKEPSTGDTTPSGSTASQPTEINPGIAEDYASMSTLELVSIATRIEGLSDYGAPDAIALSSGSYQTFSRSNPVLAELEQRPDAVAVLHSHALSGTTIVKWAACALINYYVNFLGFSPPELSTPANANEWIVSIDQYAVVYEYTTNPKISYSGLYPILDFDGTQFLLNSGTGLLHNKSPNFWFRVELKANAEQILEAHPSPRPTYASNGSWVEIYRYSNGWFVCGYAEKLTEISFSFDPRPTSSTLHQISLVAFPNSIGELTYNLAKNLHEHTSLLVDLFKYNGNRDLSHYPPFAELLRREDAITTLLQLSAKDQSLSHLLYYNVFMERMTDAEKAAKDIIINQSGYFTATPLSAPAIVETDNGRVMNGFEGCHVSNVPSNLQNIPLSSMNCWIYVPLTEGGQILRQAGWKLEAYAGSAKLGAWILYDSSTNRQVGWIVSGTVPDDSAVWLKLTQSSATLEKTEVIPILLAT